MEFNDVPLLFAINTTFAFPSNTLNEMPVARNERWLRVLPSASL
jgi:hypothetical protein